jgi:peptide chain release factor 1
VAELSEMSANKADAEMSELAAPSCPRREAKADALLEQLKEEFVSAEDNAIDSFFFEIRAGTGGDEPALFAGDCSRCIAATARAKGGSSTFPIFRRAIAADSRK